MIPSQTRPNIGGGAMRPMAVAGAFYPADPVQLKHDVQVMLRGAGNSPGSEGADLAGERAPKAIIVPHAGYMYSGETAARAYACLAGMRGTVRRVVLLGPAHRMRVLGLALPEADCFETPFGAVAVDHDALREIAHLRQVVAARPVHAAEHALEVHLPFLMETLGEFALVPLVVGECSSAMVAEVIDTLWGDTGTLVVVSSDLSHFHSYQDAVRLDNQTVATILACDPRIGHEQACGATVINALLEIAILRGLRIELIDQCNSGDTAGGRDRVVGYASFALYEAPVARDDYGISSESLVPQWFPADGGKLLVAVARAAIERALGVAHTPPASAPWLSHLAAVFVTLTVEGALRGCIGSLEAHRPLATDVAENAVAAALRDPRFAPITVGELASIRIEVSLLTPPMPLAFVSESDLIARLRPARDGLIFEAAGRRSTFLPQVWEQIPEPRMFLEALKKKAGFAANFWGPDVHVLRYYVAKFSQ